MAFDNLIAKISEHEVNEQGVWKNTTINIPAGCGSLQGAFRSKPEDLNCTTSFNNHTYVTKRFASVNLTACICTTTEEMKNSEENVNTRTCHCITDFCNDPSNEIDDSKDNRASKENANSKDNGASEIAMFGLLLPTIIFMAVLY